MKIFSSSLQDAVSTAANRIADFAAHNRGSMIAFGYNAELAKVYQKLVSMCEEGLADFSGVKAAVLMEFENSTIITEELRKSFFSPAGIPDDNIISISEYASDNPAQFDAVFSQIGGIALAVTGLGKKGQVLFNEPGAQFCSFSHRQKLSSLTLDEFSKIFPGTDLPNFGLTAGIKTVASAKEILIIALGEEKADAVFSTVYSRDDGIVPSAYLQLPMYVELYADEDASSRL